MHFKDFEDPMKFNTKAIHAGYDGDPETGATSIPIYQTASFEHDNAQLHSDIFNGRAFGHQYSRITNPTVFAYEGRINALENGLGTLCTASGMAAISTALFSLTSTGDEIISARTLFGGTHYLYQHLLENFGVKINIVPTTDVKAYEAAITDKTKLIFLETIGNPKLDIPDIKAIAAIAKAHNIPLVVDCTTTTPYLFDAKAHGVSVLLLSLTKFMCGSGTTIGGSITDTGNYDWKNGRPTRVKEAAQKFGDMAFLGHARRQIQSNTGSIMSPMNAFIASLGLDTLSLRMDRHCDNALKLATFLDGHSKVVKANYPGLKTHENHELAKVQFNNKFGGILTLRVGSKANAYKVIDGLEIARLLVNIGDTKTLVVHPQSTIYRNFTTEEAADLGAFEDTIRVSVGLEDIEDLIADFDQALSQI